jgi:hypothetical protein
MFVFPSLQAFSGTNSGLELGKVVNKILRILVASFTGEQGGCEGILERKKIIRDVLLDHFELIQLNLSDCLSYFLRIHDKEKE